MNGYFTAQLAEQHRNDLIIAAQKRQLVAGTTRPTRRGTGRPATSRRWSMRLSLAAR